jgi:hypothetical protein
MINWELIREVYSCNLENKDTGMEAFPGDVAYGVLYIQRKPDLTDRELVDQIVENPYMQYFIGYKEYRNKNPLTRACRSRFGSACWNPPCPRF